MSSSITSEFIKDRARRIVEQVCDSVPSGHISYTAGNALAHNIEREIMWLIDIVKEKEAYTKEFNTNPSVDTVGDKVYALLFSKEKSLLGIYTKREIAEEARRLSVKHPVADDLYVVAEVPLNQELGLNEEAALDGERVSW
jgi:hypothetical protein